MTESEYLLTKLIEECAEVIQRATKALTFGLTEVQPGHTQDNSIRLTYEFGDLQSVWELLSEKGVVREPTIHMLALKRAKMAQFMQYSRQLGTLDPVSEHSGAEVNRAPGNVDQSFA
jgi:hypothetical protein